MANLSKSPGDDKGEPIESRRATLVEADPSDPVPPGEAEGPIPDLPTLGEFASESARPTPLDEIAEAEREQAPRD